MRESLFEIEIKNLLCHFVYILNNIQRISLHVRSFFFRRDYVNLNERASADRY